MVAVLQRGQEDRIFHKLVWFFRVFLKWSQWSCNTTPFFPCQKQLCSQGLVLVHISLHANELCSTRPSLLWKSKGDLQIIIKKYKGWDLLLLEVQLDHEQWVRIHPWVFLAALNCPSFRKQSGVKWFTLPDIIEFSEREVKWRVAR